MCVDKVFFESLLWSALYQLEKVKDKHGKLFKKFRADMYEEVGDFHSGYVDVDDYESFENDTSRLASLYKNVFVASQEEKCFLQNARFENEFDDQSIIGRGTFGTVFKVTHKIDGQNYAIKRQITTGIRENKHNFNIIMTCYF